MEKKTCFYEEEYQRILWQDRFRLGCFVEYMNKIKSFIQNETLNEKELKYAVIQAYNIAWHADSLDKGEGANCFSVLKEINEITEGKFFEVHRSGVIVPLI